MTAMKRLVENALDRAKERKDSAMGAAVRYAKRGSFKEAQTHLGLAMEHHAVTEVLQSILDAAKAYELDTST